MEPRRRGLASYSSLTHPEEPHPDIDSDGLLVIGDDAVSNRFAEQVERQEEVVLVGLGEPLLEGGEQTGNQSLQISRIPDLFETDLSLSPTTAVVATSEDSQNLLIVHHLRRQLDVDNIVVRVNESQYIDVFADLSVEFVDVPSIVGSELAESVDPVRHSE